MHCIFDCITCKWPKWTESASKRDKKMTEQDRRVWGPFKKKQMVLYSSDLVDEKGSRTTYSRTVWGYEEMGPSPVNLLRDKFEFYYLQIIYKVSIQQQQLPFTKYTTGMLVTWFLYTHFHEIFHFMSIRGKYTQFFICRLTQPPSKKIWKKKIVY